MCAAASRSRNVSRLCARRTPVYFPISRKSGKTSYWPTSCPTSGTGGAAFAAHAADRGEGAVRRGGRATPRGAGVVRGSVGANGRRALRVGWGLAPPIAWRSAVGRAPAPPIAWRFAVGWGPAPPTAGRSRSPRPAGGVACNPHGPPPRARTGNGGAGPTLLLREKSGALRALESEKKTVYASSMGSAPTDTRSCGTRCPGSRGCGTPSGS